jgi:hypothetical protein
MKVIREGMPSRTVTTLEGITSPAAMQKRLWSSTPHRNQWEAPRGVKSFLVGQLAQFDFAGRTALASG